MAAIYVSPTGSGDKSGSDAANALPVTSLNKAIQLAGPGGSVQMLADQGSYDLTTAINITTGGTDGAPVTVMGVDSLGNEMNIQVNGTRMDEYVVGGAAGNECFKLLAGANNLVFENMSFADVATAFRVGADVSNIVIEDMYADNVRRFFEDIVSGSNTSATVSGLTIRNVEVHGFSKGVVRLQYDSNNILIENVYGDSERQDGDGIAIGIHLAGTVHGAVVRATTMDNAQCSTSDYWNGDGFATERGVYDVTFEDTIARGNADGGYDLKSNDTTLIRAIAEGNGRNFRLWGEATLIDCVGIDPHKWGGTIGGQFQIQVMDGANVTVTGGIFVDSGRTTAVAVNDGGGILTFIGTHFVHAEDGRLTLGSDIFGIDPALVTLVTNTGVYSSNGSALLEQLRAALEDAQQPDTGDPAETPPVEDDSGEGTVESGGEPLPTDPTSETGTIDEVQTALGVGSSLQQRRSAMFQLPGDLKILTGTSDLGQGLRGNSGDNIINGAGGDDFIDLTDGGEDKVSSSGGRDVLYYGAALSSGDVNDAGDEGGDVRGDLLVIQGDYTLTLGADALIDVEKFRVLKAENTSFGHDSGGLFNYDIATVDANVAAGDLLVVQGGSLQLGETLRFDGSAELDGRFQLFGGRDDDELIGGAGDDHILGRAGNDTLTGNGGNDRLRGGLGGDALDGGEGSDTFIYAALPHASEPYTAAALESTSLDYDTMFGFDAAQDRIDLPQSVAGLAEVIGGSLSDATLDADLAAAVDAALEANGAALFTADAGDHSGRTFLVVDADGNGAYEGGIDFLIGLQDPVNLASADTGIFV